MPSSEVSDRVRLPIQQAVLADVSANSMVAELVADMAHRLLATRGARGGSLVIKTSMDAGDYVVSGSCLTWETR